MQLVQTITLTSIATNMQFTSIPQTGKHLYLVVSARSTTAATNVNLSLYVNDIATFSYYQRRLRGDGSSVSSSEDAGSRPWTHPQMPAASAFSSTFGLTDFMMPNYTGSGNRPMSSDSVSSNNVTACQLLLVAGYINSGPITKLEIADTSGGSLAVDSTASLYIIN
jgi:hypothetical protein